MHLKQNKERKKKMNNYNYLKKNNWQRKALLLGIILCVILTSMTIVNVVIAYKVNATPSVPSYEIKYAIEFEYHTVEAGESLSYIAEKYIGDYPGSFYEYQGLICRENRLSNANYIVVGDMLQIPIYKEVVTSGEN